MDRNTLEGLHRAHVSRLGADTGQALRTHGYDLSLKNGGVSLLKTKYIPAKVWSEINGAKGKIVSGAIKIPAASKAGDVQKLIK